MTTPEMPVAKDATTRVGYIRNLDAWLTELQETGQASVSGPLRGRFDIGQAVDEIRFHAASLGINPEDLDIGAAYVWKLIVRVKRSAEHGQSTDTAQRVVRPESTP